MLEKRVSVRKDLCVGCGLCTNMTDVLIIGDDGLAEAITEIIDETKIEELEEAKKACPVGAIEIE